MERWAPWWAAPPFPPLERLLGSLSSLPYSGRFGWRGRGVPACGVLDGVPAAREAVVRGGACGGGRFS